MKKQQSNLFPFGLKRNRLVYLIFACAFALALTFNGCKNNAVLPKTDDVAKGKLKTNYEVCNSYSHDVWTETCCDWCIPGGTYVRTKTTETVQICHQESAFAPPTDASPTSYPAAPFDNTATFSASSSTPLELSTYLNNFNPSANATITVYVEEPTFHSDGPWYAPSNIGDAFIEIQQGSTTKVFGYYALGGVTPIIKPDTTGIFVDKSGANFDISITFAVPAAKFQNVLQYLADYLNTHHHNGPGPGIHGHLPIVYDYNFFTNNNVDFATDIATIAGLGIIVPATHFPGLGYARPASFLGERFA